VRPEIRRCVAVFALLLPAGLAKIAKAFPGGALPAEAAPSASVTLEPNALAPGQMAILQIEVAGAFHLAKAPVLPLVNLETVAGPSLENRFEWINGRSSSRTLLVYRVRAGKAGRAGVGPIHLVDPAGRTITTAPLAINVGGAASDVEPAPAETSDPALVSRIEPAAPYASQQAIWTLYLVTRGQATQGEIESLPDFRGFWVEDLERESNVTPKVWNLGGVLWRAYPMIRKALFPIRPGKLTIGPARARMAVRRLSFDFFDSPFGDESPVERASTPLAIVCRAKGAGPATPVGSFTLRDSLDRTHLPLGGAFAITAQLTGDGRLSEIPAPALAIPGARVSEPEARLTTRRAASRLSSTKTWQWVVTPDKPGEVVVPALSLPVFDPATSRLVTIASSPLRAFVEPPVVPAAPTLPPPAVAVPPRRAAAGIAVAGAGALLLLLLGFWLGRRGMASRFPADVEAIPESERLDRLLDDLEARAAGRGEEDRERVSAWRRRLQEIRFAPVFSSRDDAARALEEEIRDAAARWKKARASRG